MAMMFMSITKQTSFLLSFVLLLHGVVIDFVIVVSAYDNGLGLTPPMGWNSWNKFACNIHEDLILDTAQAIIDLKLHKFGYRYINLDDCWQISRNSTGYIQEDFEKFPNGIRYLSDTIHNMVDDNDDNEDNAGTDGADDDGDDNENNKNSAGLLFGLYSSAGIKTCQRRPGSLRYETQDSISYIVEYNVDYLKYDNCYSLGILPQRRYQTMHDALNKTGESVGRSIFFSMCEWGNLNVATWGKPIGNSWRTTGDIHPTFNSIITIADKNNKWHEYASIGGWNDPDMLEIGNGDLTVEEQKSHFTLWCLMKAPLLLGMDVTQLTQDSVAYKIITNKELIAINQDPLGIQGYKRTPIKVRKLLVAGDDDYDDNLDEEDDDLDLDLRGNSGDNLLEVWAGPLVDDNIIVVLFNRSTKSANITANWSDIGISNSELKYNVRDLWKHEDLPGTFTGNITAVVESHDVVALRLSPASSVAKEQDGMVAKIGEVQFAGTTRATPTSTKLRG